MCNWLKNVVAMSPVLWKQSLDICHGPFGHSLYESLWYRAESEYFEPILLTSQFLRHLWSKSLSYTSVVRKVGISTFHHLACFLLIPQTLCSFCSSLSAFCSILSDVFPCVTFFLCVLALLVIYSLNSHNCTRPPGVAFIFLLLPQDCSQLRLTFLCSSRS